MRKESSCEGCRTGRFDLPLEMAFQPIVNIGEGSLLAYEALVRGPNGEGAMSVISQVNDSNRYGFDQACRVRAIELASELALTKTGALLSINFMPNAVYRPEACIRSTFEAARRTGFPLSSIMFEFTENEQILDVEHVKRILLAYKEMGFKTAIDDFGAGHSGLALLTKIQPDFIKIDMQLVRNVDTEIVKRKILRGVATIAQDLGIAVIAEGIETEGEYAALRDIGIHYLQGYFLAKPAFRLLPAINVLERVGGI